MGYDYALIAALDARNRSEQRAYRCPFVDAIRGARPVPAEWSDGRGRLLDHAIRLLTEPANPDWLVNEEVRGQVARKEPLAMDDPRQMLLEHLPCGSWHQQQNRGERITLAVAGEFEAR